MPGPDWRMEAQCAQCAELTLQLIQDRPDGQPIQIFQCIRCGSQTRMPPGWTTRCHVCHDTGQLASGSNVVKLSIGIGLPT